MKRLHAFAMPALQAVADGTWRNAIPHDDEAFTVPEWFVMAARIGVASGLGWVEIDDTWWRLTDSGKAALLGEKS